MNNGIDHAVFANVINLCPNNNQMDYISLANLILTFIVAVCALYLSFAALKHTARPNVEVRLINSSLLPCGKTVTFIFGFSNIGHWYAKPMAINLVAFCNFDAAFELIELRYGSTQSFVNTDIKEGVGGMNYLKAKGLKLTYGEESEQVHIKAVVPKMKGRYKIRISAYSDNGVSFMKEFAVECA